MRVLFGIALGWVLIGSLCTPASAEQRPPQETLERLGEMFAITRDTLWEINDGFWHAGEYEHCIANLRLIAQIDPRDVEAFDSAAWLMQNFFRDDEAEPFLRTGLLNNPDVYDLYFSLGYFLYMHMRYDEAIPMLETAASFDVPFFVLHLLAHTYELAGNSTDSLDIWLQMEYTDPQFNVPTSQIDRVLGGDPPVNMPETTQRWRQERREREQNAH